MLSKDTRLLPLSWRKCESGTETLNPKLWKIYPNWRFLFYKTKYSSVERSRIRHPSVRSLIPGLVQSVNDMCPKYTIWAERLADIALAFPSETEAIRSALISSLSQGHPCLPAGRCRALVASQTDSWNLHLLQICEYPVEIDCNDFVEHL